MKTLKTALAAILAAALASMAAAQTLPSGAPYPTPGDSTGSPIRLQPWEYRLPFVGGCAAIVDISFEPPVTKLLAPARWLGACPYGVANGPGFLLRDGAAVPQTFAYGKIVWGPSASSVGTSVRPGPPFYYTKVIIPAWNLTPEQNQAHGNDYTQIVSKLEINDTEIRSTDLAVTSLYCPGVLDFLKKPENRFGIWIFDKAARKEMQTYCKSNRGIFALLHSVQVYSWDYEDRRADKINPKELNFLRVCPVSSRLQCVQMTEDVITPYRAELQALNRTEDADNRAVLADIRARFRPLEDARRAATAEWLRKNAAAGTSEQPATAR